MTPDAAGRLWEHTRRQPAARAGGAARASGRRQLAARAASASGPESYAQLVRRDARPMCAATSSTLIEAAAVLGVRAPLHAVRRAGRLERSARDAGRRGRRAGSCALDDRAGGAFVEFSHPLARAADLRRAAEGAALRAQHRRGGHRARHRRRRCGTAWKRRRSPTTRCSPTSRRTRTPRWRAVRGRAPSSSLIAASRLTPVPGRPRAAGARGDRGDAVLGRRRRRAAARRADGLRRRPAARQRARVPRDVRGRPRGGRSGC